MFFLKGCLIDHLCIKTAFFLFSVLCQVVTNRGLLGSKGERRSYEQQPRNQKSWERLNKSLLFCLDQAFFSLTAISCLDLEINEFTQTRLNLVETCCPGPSWEVRSWISHQAPWFFARLTEKTNPTLENENWVYYWLSGKQVARSAISTVNWKALCYDNLLTCQLSYFHSVVGGWVQLLYNRLKWQLLPGSATKLCIAVTRLASHWLSWKIKSYIHNTLSYCWFSKDPSSQKTQGVVMCL